MSKYKQKFQYYDIVKVTKTMPPFMSHFKGDFKAIVLGSYYDQYGKRPTVEPEYTLMPIEGEEKGNEISWYYESQLTFLRKGTQQMVYDLREEFENKHL